MNMKDNVILLIFLLSILGLIVGICYTEDLINDSPQKGDFDTISEDIDNIEPTITLENNNNLLNETNFFNIL